MEEGNPAPPGPPALDVPAVPVPPEGLAPPPPPPPYAGAAPFPAQPGFPCDGDTGGEFPVHAGVLLYEPPPPDPPGPCGDPGNEPPPPPPVEVIGPKDESVPLKPY